MLTSRIRVAGHPRPRPPRPPGFRSTSELATKSIRRTWTSPWMPRRQPITSWTSRSSPATAGHSRESRSRSRASRALPPGRRVPTCRLPCLRHRRRLSYHRETQRETRQAPEMIDQESGMQDSTREKIKEAAQSGLVQLIMPGVMAVAMLFLGYAVNRLSDHFDRIDAHLANSDTTTTVLRRDVDDQKVQVQA